MLINAQQAKVSAIVHVVCKRQILYPVRLHVNASYRSAFEGASGTMIIIVNAVNKTEKTVSCTWESNPGGWVCGRCFNERYRPLDNEARGPIEGRHTSTSHIRDIWSCLNDIYDQI